MEKDCSRLQMEQKIANNKSEGSLRVTGSTRFLSYDDG